MGVLLRRIWETDPEGLAFPEVLQPLRVPASRLLRQGELERSVEFVARRVGQGGGALVLLDCDDGCPAELGPALAQRITAARPDLRSGVVLAKREYEAWFLAAADSLRVQRGLPPDDRDNLLPGVFPADFVGDLQAGSGNELATKFRAVHSSSALAVNTFAPFRRQLDRLEICGLRTFSGLCFERKCPTGLGGTPPNLDVFLEAEDTVIGIESKLLEYLTPKAAKFADSYEREKLGVDVGDPWWGVLQGERRTPQKRQLDVAQLVKHYLGLRHSCPGRDLVLLYLFWEPVDPTVDSVFRQHRDEIAWLQKAVSGGGVRFEALSYPELWEAWENSGILPGHVAHLRERYCVTV